MEQELINLGIAKRRLIQLLRTSIKQYDLNDLTDDELIDLLPVEDYRKVDLDLFYWDKFRYFVTELTFMNYKLYKLNLQWLKSKYLY